MTALGVVVAVVIIAVVVLLACCLKKHKRLCFRPPGRSNLTEKSTRKAFLESSN